MTSLASGHRIVNKNKSKTWFSIAGSLFCNTLWSHRSTYPQAVGRRSTTEKAQFSYGCTRAHSSRQRQWPIQFVIQLWFVRIFAQKWNVQCACAAQSLTTATIKRQTVQWELSQKFSWTEEWNWSGIRFGRILVFVFFFLRISKQRMVGQSWSQSSTQSSDRRQRI